MHHYIYRTTCLITNKFYMGMHSTMILNDSYLGSGKRLLLSVKKYGKANHKKDIIELVNSREELIEREKELVNEDLLTNPDCLNLTIGGRTWFELHKKDGTEIIYCQSTTFKEHLRKLKEDLDYKKIWCSNISKSLLGEKNQFFGKHHSDDHKLKMSILQKKINHKGERNCQFGKLWLHNDDLKCSKIIQPSDLEKFISNGWKKGRKMIFNPS